MTDEKLDKIVIRGGTTVHFRGMPLWLPEDTVFEGRIENMRLLSQDDENAYFKVDEKKEGQAAQQRDSTKE